VHLVLWPAPSVEILLNHFRFSDVLLFLSKILSLLAVVKNTTVAPSSEPTHEPENSKFNQGEDSVDCHSADERITNEYEPVLVEVAHRPAIDAGQEGLLSEVSVSEEKQESSVEELGVECEVSNESQLGCLSLLSHLLYDLDNQFSDDVVDSNN